jgi:2-keto-4-pentenoate hydratase/2-oxohepta-3-ene-1,7-dioic acid hydratase in catechol pathway
MSGLEIHKKYFRVESSEGARWVEKRENRDRYSLLTQECSPSSPVIEKELSSKDFENLILLPPFFGNKVVGLAYNYSSLIGENPDQQETEPLLFLKAPGSVHFSVDGLAYPATIRKMWVEVEVALVIGERCCNVSPEDACGKILGVTVASDVSAENVHGRDHHLARSKAIDGFCPILPYIISGLNTSNLYMSTCINDRRTQEGRTNERILNDEESVAFISKFISLDPGDLVLTGTPKGALDSIVKPKDRIRHIVESVGELNFEITA